MSEVRHVSSGNCGACGEPIRPDRLTGATCACARRGPVLPDATPQHALVRRLWEAQLREDVPADMRRLMAEAATEFESGRVKRLESALQSYMDAVRFAPKGSIAAAIRAADDEAMRLLPTRAGS